MCMYIFIYSRTSVDYARCHVLCRMLVNHDATHTLYRAEHIGSSLSELTVHNTAYVCLQDVSQSALNHFAVIALMSAEYGDVVA